MLENSSSVVLLVTLLLTMGLCVWMWQRMAAVARVQTRLELRAAELRRVVAMRAQLAVGQVLTEGAVQGGTATVRAIHKGIASIPFSILENIPATRDTTRVVRFIHDSISEGVYGGISMGNKLIGQAARSAIRAKAVDASRTDELPDAANKLPPASDKK